MLAIFEFFLESSQMPRPDCRRIQEEIGPRHGVEGKEGGKRQFSLTSITGTARCNEVAA